MRILVINRRNVLVYAMCILVIAVLVFANSIYLEGTIEVFSTAKLLPIYSVETPDKTAAITFDCAWGSGDIPDILNTLKKENVKATFFIVGAWAKKYPEAVKAIAEDGHDIANHSLSHFRMGVLDNAKIASEIKECDTLLESLSGKSVDLFRPPYGDYSNNVISAAKDLGYHTIQWNVDSLDWKPQISQSEIINRIKLKLRPGSIILFHNDTEHTAKILPTIIANIKNEGYTLKPVSQMIMRDNYEINFEGRQKAKE